MSLLPVNPLLSITRVLGVAAFIGLMLLTGYLAYTKSRLQTEVAEAQNLIVVLKNANTDWKRETERANEAIAKMVADGQARAAQAAAALEASQEQARAYSDQADALLRQRAIGDDCAATKRFLADYFATPR